MLDPDQSPCCLASGSVPAPKGAMVASWREDAKSDAQGNEASIPLLKTKSVEVSR